GPQRLLAHNGGVDDLAGLERYALLEHRDAAVVGDELDAGVAGLRRRDGGGDLGRTEVARGHRRDVRARVGAPGAHRVRVLAGVRLHRRRGAPVGVALAQHGVHGAALDRVVALARLALRVGGRLVRVVGQVEALLLQLLDG